MTQKVTYFLMERKRREGSEGRRVGKRKGQKMPFDARDTFASILPTLLSNVQVLIEKVMRQQGNDFVSGAEAIESEF